MDSIPLYPNSFVSPSVEYLWSWFLGLNNCVTIRKSIVTQVSITLWMTSLLVFVISNAVRVALILFYLPLSFSIAH